MVGRRRWSKHPRRHGHLTRRGASMALTCCCFLLRAHTIHVVHPSCSFFGAEIGRHLRHARSRRMVLKLRPHFHVNLPPRLDRRFPNVLEDQLAFRALEIVVSVSNMQPKIGDMVESLDDELLHGLHVNELALGASHTGGQRMSHLHATLTRGGKGSCTSCPQRP